MHAHPTVYQVYISDSQRGRFAEAQAGESEAQYKRAVVACSVCESSNLSRVQIPLLGIVDGWQLKFGSRVHVEALIRDGLGKYLM